MTQIEKHQNEQTRIKKSLRKVIVEGFCLNFDGNSSTHCTILD